MAGHAGILRDGTGPLQGSPVVGRFDGDGRPDPRCERLFTWRPAVPQRPLPSQPTEESFARTVEAFTAPSYDIVVNDAVVDDQGRIVLVGYLHWLEAHGRLPWVGRLTEDCRPDETFGITGSGSIVLPTADIALAPPTENAWLSAVALEPETGRILVGGTVTAFDAARGFFAGRVLVAALLADGRLDSDGFGAFGSRGGVVIAPEGWYEELHGLAYIPVGEDGDEARVVLVGESYQDEARSTRRVRAATVYPDGWFGESARPVNTRFSGVVDAWATDVSISPDRRVFVSVSHRSGPPLPFPGPIPPPFPRP